MNHIRVDQINHSFQTVSGGDPILALKDVSFEIEQGEFVSLLGPSGCGKTPSSASCTV